MLWEHVKTDNWLVVKQEQELHVLFILYSASLQNIIHYTPFISQIGLTRIIICTITGNNTCCPILRILHNLFSEFTFIDWNNHYTRNVSSFSDMNCTHWDKLDVISSRGTNYLIFESEAALMPIIQFINSNY